MNEDYFDGIKNIEVNLRKVFVMEYVFRQKYIQIYRNRDIRIYIYR